MSQSDPERVGRAPSGSNTGRSWTARGSGAPGPRRSLIRRDVHTREAEHGPDNVASSCTTVEPRPRKGQLRAVEPPGAQSSPPAARGPAWLVTLLDFIERATSRTTSLWQHLAMFVAYSLVIAGLPIFAVAWVVTRFVALGSWPGMSSIAAVAATAGLTIIMRRFRREIEGPLGLAAADDAGNQAGERGLREPAGDQGAGQGTGTDQEWGPSGRAIT